MNTLGKIVPSPSLEPLLRVPRLRSIHGARVRGLERARDLSDYVLPERLRPSARFTRFESPYGEPPKRLQEFAAILGTKEAMERGEFGTFEAFLNWLERKVTTRDLPDLWEGLHRILVSSDAWCEAENFVIYLRNATRNELERATRDREISERLWERDHEASMDLDLFSGAVRNPQEQAEHSEALELGREILQEVASEAPERQRKLIELITAGHGAAGALEATGATWSDYTSIQQKIQRRLKLRVQVAS